MKSTGETRQRNRAIADAYTAGEKIEAIGARYGITRQRVEQIARMMECPLRRFQENHNPVRSCWLGRKLETSPEKRVIDLGERIFCEQCQCWKRPWQATECGRPFCKAKVEAA